MTGNIPPVIRPEHVTPRSLEMLVSELGLLSRGDLRGVEIVGLTVMTREVTPGDMFVALRGANRHGAEFVTDARDNGAVAVLTDEEGATIAANAGLPLVIVDSPRDALGEIARWIYRTDDDAPQYFGITGTNGKNINRIPARRSFAAVGNRDGIVDHSGTTHCGTDCGFEAHHARGERVTRPHRAYERSVGARRRH